MTQSTIDTRGPKRADKRIRVRLTCGCVIGLRDNPLRATAKFGCDAGLGHGYQLSWVEWHNPYTGRSAVNHLPAEGK